MTSIKHKTDSERQEIWKESVMERHDLYNFETKIDYVIDRTQEKKNSSFLLETFFFIPESLQINEESYKRKQYFLDLNNRIRFKTPQMSIKGLLDKNNTLSPVNVILEKLQEIEYGSTERELEIRIEREIRLLACIIKVSLRDQFNYYLDNFQTLKKQYDIDKLLGVFLESIENLEEMIIDLRNKFLLAQVPIKLREAFRFADEYISLQIKTWVAQTLKIIEKQLDAINLGKLIEIIEREQEYRRSINSKLILDENSSNEEFTYHESIFKKYVQGVLYLEKRKKDPRSTFIEVLYSVAAGLAMFFSLFLGFFFLIGFEINSLPFIIGTVVIYMFKDRIKDNIRGISNRAIGLYFPDKRVDIMDEFYKKKLGEIREKVHYIEFIDLPQDILQIRRSGNESPLEEEGKPEVVLSYKQALLLFHNKIDQIHTRKKNISNIIRFNVREFLRYADDPIQNELLWNNIKRTVDIIPVSKVYHLNIVVKLTNSIGKEVKKVSVKKFRVILDQNGINRIEEPEISL